MGRMKLDGEQPAKYYNCIKRMKNYLDLDTLRCLDENYFIKWIKNV